MDMRNRNPGPGRLAHLALAIVVGFMVMQAWPAHAGDIAWTMYEDGLKTAKTKNLPVLVDFSTSWCGKCRKMDRETFTDPNVIKAVTDSFVAVRVDGDERRDLASRFRVFGYPTFLVLDGDGNFVRQCLGYMDAEEFITFLADNNTGNN